MASTTSQTDSTQNPTYVYYLHPLDHANLKLVNIVFNGWGYRDSKRSMIIGLIAKDNLCFVDGSLSNPQDNDPKKKAWNDVIIRSSVGW